MIRFGVAASLSKVAVVMSNKNVSVSIILLYAFEQLKQFVCFLFAVTPAYDVYTLHVLENNCGRWRMDEKSNGAGRIIGWREWIALPGLNIPAIKAKIDTGARTSALHALNIEAFKAGGRQKVRFRVRPLQRKKKVLLSCETDILERRIVSDSGGHRELRYVICSDVILGDLLWPIEITLTSRDTLKFRMLLGRTALRERFIVDPARSYTTGRSLSKSYSGT